MAKKTYLTAVVAGGFCALSLAVAPMASAAQTAPTCSHVGGQTTLCQSNGSASLRTSPEIRANGWSPSWYGYGGYHRR